MAENTVPTSQSEKTTEASQKKSPVCLIVLGMAGSGKTSLVHRLSNSEKKPYVVNLDPACIQLPYFANIGNLHLFCNIYSIIV